MAKATLAGISTLGMLLGYGVETSTGTKPLTFTNLPRVNSIGGIELSTETIDASALEDEVTRTIAGRADTGGEWTLSFNLTDETATIYQKMLTEAAEGLAEGHRTWFEVWSKNLKSAFFIVAQPGGQIPMPEIGQNELLVCELTLALDEYIGFSSEGVVKPVDAEE